MKRENLKDKAYSIIKSKIINCEYAPNDFLNESELSAQIEVSRTPIREALNILEQENLVKIFPKRGVLVTDISVAEINEIYIVRELIEPHIIVAYHDNMDKSELIDICDTLRREDISRDKHSPYIYKIDADIHRMLVAKSRNRYYTSIMEKIYCQNQRIRIMAGKRIDLRLEETQNEHLNVIQCMLDEKWQEAADAMLTHLKNSRRAAIISMSSE